jgi:hypothetical protein
MANEYNHMEGLQSNIALSESRVAEQELAKTKRDKAEQDWLEYATGRAGQAYDPVITEQFKNSVPPHQFERALYNLQESTFPVGESIGGAILDIHAGDNPNAFKNYENFDNKEANVAWANRNKYHNGVFSYSSREDYKELDDDTYDLMGVIGYISEIYDVDAEQVAKNQDGYFSQYAETYNLDDAKLPALFDHMRGTVMDRNDAAEQDGKYWSEGIDWALSGLPIPKMTKDNKRQVEVMRMAADHIYGNYKDNIIKAREIIKLADTTGSSPIGEKAEGKSPFLSGWGGGVPDAWRQMGDGSKSSLSSPSVRYDLANKLMEESPEDQEQILSFVFKLTEMEGELVEGSVNRVFESFTNAVNASVEDIISGTEPRGGTRQLANKFLPKSMELGADELELKQDRRLGLRQALRRAESNYRRIEAQGTGEMIAQTTAANVHYMGMFALGWAGMGAMWMDMSSKSDEQYRLQYPDMDADARWGMAVQDGLFDMVVEKAKYTAIFGGFPSLTKLVGGKGIMRAAGVLGVRATAANVAQYGEEAVQGMSNSVLQHIWNTVGADVPAVAQEDWDENFWMYKEDGEKVPFWDGELFVSLLGLSVLMAGGRGVYDKFGGKEVKRMLNDVDKLMMQGYTKVEAEEISTINKTDTVKAFETFQDGLADKSKTERRENMNQAKAEGAGRRILEKEVLDKKKDVEENGTEEEKRDWRIKETQYDFTMKYDAHLEEREDGKWELVAPASQAAPSEIFDTKQEADEAMLQHYNKVDRAWMGNLSQQLERVEAMTKQESSEAMKLAVEEIKKQHAKAGMEADIRLDQDVQTMTEFASQGAAEMKTALERVQHELLRKEILRPATVADFDDWVINAEVQLKKDGRGYIERIAKGGNISDVYEDASEGFLAMAIHNNVVDKGWVKEQLFAYQRDSGDSPKWGFESAEQISDLRMKEAFSDLAVANLWNAANDNKVGKLSGIIRALKHFFKSVINSAENLLKMQAEGKVDTDFQILLDKSVGLNMDEQIARQTVEAQKEILEEIVGDATSMSISDKGYKDRIGKDQGKPLTETEIREGVEDESGTVVEPEIDDDKFLNAPEITTDTSFSIASKVPVISRESLAGKRKFAYMSDRTRVGVYEGLHPESKIRIDLQGGWKYPYIVGHKKSGAAWAFTDLGMATRFINRINKTDGIGLTTLYAKGNLVANHTFLKAYMEEAAWSIKSGDITEERFLEVANQMRESANKSKKGGKPFIPLDTEAGKLFSKEWTTLPHMEQALDSASFEVRSNKFFAYNEKKAGENKGAKIGSDSLVAEGFPSVSKMVDLFADPDLEGLPRGTIVGAIQFEKNQSGGVSAKDIGAEEHISYPVVVTGEPLGAFDKPIYILDVIKTDKKVNQALRSVEVKMADVSFSIGRTTITPTADTKVVEGSNATVVGEASFSIGAWHGTPHKVDKFKTENIGTGEGAQAYGYGLYFAESRGVAESYMDKFKGEQTFRMESDGKPLGIKIFTPQDVFAARKVEELGVTKAKDFFANIISNRESLIDSGVLDNDDIGDYEDALKLVENIPTGVTNIKLVEDFDSRVYKVELNVEQEQLLDWDKPLSEQSEMVRTSVAKLADHARGIINESGEVSHLRFVDRMQMEKLEGQYTYLALDILSTRKGLSELFARFGIKGIKYLDGTSRKDGEGTYNYVMFDDADIKITEENGKAVSMDDAVSMSISPATDALLDKMADLARDPDMRMQIYKQMAVKVKQAQAALLAGEDQTTDAIVTNMKTIEAIVSVLPMEIRYKAGRAAAMTKFTTVEQGMKYLTKRLDRIDTLIEEYLVKDLYKRVKRGIQVSQPTGKHKASATGRSKIGDEARAVVGADGEIDFKYIGHRISKAAAKAVNQNPQQAAASAAGERAKIDEDTTVAKQQEYEDVAYTYELFADIKNADSNRLQMMLDLITINWEEGRKGWRRELGKRKDWGNARKGAIIKGLLGKDWYQSSEEDNKAKTKKSGVFRAMARETVSIYHLVDFMREDMMDTPAGKYLKNMVDELRRASNAFDMEQINHRQKMKKAFSDIFQFKGTNKTARVQARVTELSKGVDRGSKLTRSIMYDLEVKANKKQMEDAYDELASNESQETVFLRDVELTRDEFNEVYSEYIANFEEGVLEGLEMPNARKVYRHSVRRDTGKRQNVGEMSQLDLLKDWLSVQQSDIKKRYRQSGYDMKYREQLNEVLDEDTKRMGLWLQDQLRQGTPATEALHRSEYGLAMATVMNYFPAVFEHKYSDTDTRLQIEGVDVAGVSKRPSSHMMRVNHKSSPLRQNALNTFNHHVMQDAFWRTHAEVLRKWGGVIRDTKVQNSIKRKMGSEFLNTLNKTLNDLEEQGATTARAQIQSDVFWRQIGKGLSLGVLGMKISSTIKNALAIANVGYTRPIGELLKTLGSGEMKQAVKELYASDTFQRRLEMGASVATRYAMEASMGGNLLFSTTTRMAELGIQPINVMDTGTNLSMAMAYVAEKQSLRKSNPNMSEADVKAQALDYVDDMMARYAQPADRMSKSLLENTRPVIGKFLVLFQSEARKYLVINALAARKLILNKGVQSRSLAAQQLIISNLVVTGGLHLIEAAFSSLFRDYGEGDDPEERFMNEFFDGKKIIAALISDQLAGVPLIGAGWQVLVNTVAGEKTFQSTANPIVRIVGGAGQLLTASKKFDENSASENANLVLSAFQSLFSAMPQTAVLAQGSNVAKDTLGLLNNALFQGLTEADTLDLYTKRLRKSASDIKKRFEDEKKAAIEAEDDYLLDQINDEMREEKIQRGYDILFELPKEKRNKYLQIQDEMEKPQIPRYMIDALINL